METLVLLIEAALVGSLAAWMCVAVFDNWRHPKLNKDAVAMVMRFELMEKDYPDDFALVAHRKIENPKIIDWSFQGIRLAETLAAILLAVSFCLLIAAAFGVVSQPFASGLAIAATAFFALIWAGFIIGGNYFHYYYCHQWGQSNHFMFMYWAFFVLIILMI